MLDARRHIRADDENRGGVLDHVGVRCPEKVPGI